MTDRALKVRLRAQYVALFLAIGIYLPYFPVWLAGKGFSTIEIGALLAAQIAVRVVSTPLSGSIADRSGRRHAVLVGLALTATAAAGALIVAGSRLQIVVAALAMAAAMGPLIPISEGEVLHASRQAGVNYGRLRLWGSAAFVIANLGAGLIIDRIGAAALMALLALMHLASAISSALLPGQRETRDESTPDVTFGAVRTLLLDPTFVLFIAAGGLAMASHAAYYGFSALHWTALGYDAFLIGCLWAIGVVAEIVLFWRIGNPSGLRHATLLMGAGAAGAVLRWAGMALSPPLPMIVALQCLHAASFAMVHVGAMIFIRHTVPPTLRSTAQTVYASLSGGVLLFAAMWLAGSLYAAGAERAFAMMAVIAALALVCAVSLARRVNPTARAAADT